MWIWTSASPAACAPGSVPRRWRTNTTWGAPPEGHLPVLQPDGAPEVCHQAATLPLYRRASAKACEKFCPTGAMVQGARGRRSTLNVGAVVLGYAPTIPRGWRPTATAASPTWSPGWSMSGCCRRGARPGTSAAAVGSQGAQKDRLAASASGPGTAPPGATPIAPRCAACMR